MNKKLPVVSIINKPEADHCEHCGSPAHVSRSGFLWLKWRFECGFTPIFSATHTGCRGSRVVVESYSREAACEAWNEIQKSSKKEGV